MTGLVVQLVLQLIAGVAAYWVGRFAERGRQLRRWQAALLARQAEYEASDRGPAAGWTFAGWLRAYDAVGREDDR